MPTALNTGITRGMLKHVVEMRLFGPAEVDLLIGAATQGPPGARLGTDHRLLGLGR